MAPGVCATIDLTIPEESCSCEFLDCFPFIIHRSKVVRVPEPLARLIKTIF